MNFSIYYLTEVNSILLYLDWNPISFAREPPALVTVKQIVGRPQLGSAWVANNSAHLTQAKVAESLNCALRRLPGLLNNRVLYTQDRRSMETDTCYTFWNSPIHESYYRITGSFSSELLTYSNMNGEAHLKTVYRMFRYKNNNPSFLPWSS